MSKKRISLLILLSVIILPILIYQIFSFQASLQYKESDPPNNTADSLKSLAISLLHNEEFFAGNVNITYIDPNHNGQWNKSQITMLNTSIADDSIGATEYIAIVEKKGEVWRVTSYKSHWKCARSIFLNFWRITPCS